MANTFLLQIRLWTGIKPSSIGSWVEGVFNPYKVLFTVLRIQNNIVTNYRISREALSSNKHEIPINHTWAKEQLGSKRWEVNANKGG